MSAAAEHEVVDVVVAAFDCAGTIARAVQSALAEPQVRNVFVIDDASRDETAARAAALAERDARVIVRRLPVNRGPSAARNLALSLGGAPWIAPLDGDDYFQPGRLARLLAAADGFDLVADDIVQVVDAAPGDGVSARTLTGQLAPRQLDFAAFVAGNASGRGRRRELGFLKPLMRRAFLDRHGLRYTDDLRLGEDYALYAQALALGARFVVLPACGYVAVMRRDSLSGRHSRGDLERLRDFDARLAAAFELRRADRRALRRHTLSVEARVRWLAVIDGFKSRSPRGFCAPFAGSPEIVGFLMRQLFAEGVRRAARLAR
jgi:succinoglycan biosynthesis protein ExoU